jgi:hypothetical protein
VDNVNEGPVVTPVLANSPIPVAPNAPRYSNLSTPKTMTPLFNDGQYAQSIASHTSHVSQERMRSNHNNIVDSYSRHLSDTESYDYPTVPGNTPCSSYAKGYPISSNDRENPYHYSTSQTSYTGKTTVATSYSNTSFFNNPRPADDYIDH